MSDAVKVGFVPLSTSARDTLVVFCDDALKLGPASRQVLGTAAERIERAAAAVEFKGKSGAAMELLEPEGMKIHRLIVIGAGKPSDLKAKDFLKFGGVLTGKLNAASEAVTVMAELPGGAMTAAQAGLIATGIRLRAYKFTRYKTRKKDENASLRAQVSIAVDDVAAARKAFAPSAHVVDGVLTARDLVNEPPNVLYPEEFARAPRSCASSAWRCRFSTSRHGQTRHERDARRLAGLGPARPRLVVMRWNGGKRDERRWPSSARASCSTLAAFRSSPLPTWKT